jgi:hypothetical protein
MISSIPAAGGQPYQTGNGYPESAPCGISIPPVDQAQGRPQFGVPPKCRGGLVQAERDRSRGIGDDLGELRVGQGACREVRGETETTDAEVAGQRGLEGNDAGTERGSRHTAGGRQGGRGGGRIGEQRKEVAPKCGGVGQRALRQRELGRIPVVVTGREPCAQGCQRGVHFGKERKLGGLARIESGVARAAIQPQDGLHPGAHQWNSPEDGDAARQSQTQAEKTGAHVGVGVGAHSA